jgi:hypothetical protein
MSVRNLFAPCIGLSIILLGIPFFRHWHYAIMKNRMRLSR